MYIFNIILKKVQVPACGVGQGGAGGGPLNVLILWRRTWKQLAEVIRGKSGEVP